MKKKYNKGFMLAETLIVTTFVSGVLIFLFIQFSSLSNKYNDSYKYNTVEGLYSIRNIRNYIKSDSNAINIIKNTLDPNLILDVTDCNIFSDTKYCLLLFDVENVKKAYISYNYFINDAFSDANLDIQKFINNISAEGNETYRLVVEFNDHTFATLRFGE